MACPGRTWEHAGRTHRDLPLETQAIPIPANHSELAPGVNYFFAVLPDDRARSDIAGVGERFCKSHRVSGSPVGIDNLHLLLCPMGKPERLRQPLEGALLALAAEVATASFVATLDSAMRFSPRDGQFPFVLCADTATTAATLNLRKAIAAAQLSAGFQVSGVSSFLPHVTLLQGHAVDAIEESITPIQWRVHEFVLIRSFFGQSRYEVIGRWPLAMEAKPEVYDLREEMARMRDLPELPYED